MGATVLVVEDDPLAARIVQLVLGTEGYQVVIAPDGFQALDVARANPPDLVLLDLMLPGMDGFDVLGQLRACSLTATVPIVVVTAKSQLTDKHMASRLGADGYVTKPYARKDLLAVVRSALDARARRAGATGTGVLLLAARGREATPVALGLGTALAADGRATDLVDLHPFSVEHTRLLDLPARPVPASPASMGGAGQLSELIVQHSGGLGLLNNLEGSGEAGQLTPGDLELLLEQMLSRGSLVLIDSPLHPPALMGHAAQRCDLVLFVASSEPATLVAARSALALMQRTGIDRQKIALVFVGSIVEESKAELGPALLGTLPAHVTPGHAAFDTLAKRLCGLLTAGQPVAGHP